MVEDSGVNLTCVTVHPAGAQNEVIDPTALNNKAAAVAAVSIRLVIIETLFCRFRDHFP